MNHTFKTDAGTMSYVDEGKGPPVLFVHGTPSWSYEWRHMIENLRGVARCIAPDHLGFGLSDKPADAPLEPADHAERLLQLVHHLDLRDLTLVVHDFGGPIGLPVALREPERVRHIVIINSWMWAHGNDRRIARMSKLVASRLGRFLYQDLNASPRWLIPMSFAQRKNLTREIHANYLQPFANKKDRSAPWVLGRALTGADPYYESLWAERDKLKSIPMTLAWGMRDPAFGSAYLDRWRKAFPHARVVEFPEAGHFPQEEAPVELSRTLGELLHAA